jgi:hypothetical protein
MHAGICHFLCNLGHTKCVNAIPKVIKIGSPRLACQGDFVQVPPPQSDRFGGETMFEILEIEIFPTMFS